MKDKYIIQKNSFNTQLEEQSTTQINIALYAATSACHYLWCVVHRSVKYLTEPPEGVVLCKQSDEQLGI